MGGQPYTKKNFNRNRGGGNQGGRGGYCGRGGSDFGGSRKNDETGNLFEAILNLFFEKELHNLFDGNLGMLDLSNLSHRESLKAGGKSIDFNSATFCKVLVSVIKQKLPAAPRFINLNNNNINAVTHILKALIESHLHESIGGISLADNRIESQDFISFLTKFTSLQEIVLKNNPVLKRGDLVSHLRKRVPSLLGIDGESIIRQPLSLPWPKRSTFDDNQRFMLEMLERNLLQQLSAKQFEGVQTLLSENANFSFSTTKRDLLNAGVKGDHKAAQADFGKLKSDLNIHSRSIIEKSQTRNLNTGRIGVVHSLRKYLYRDEFTVLHDLSPNASVVFFDVPLMKIPTCIVTLHGRILWRHNKVPQERILCFDRTLSLTYVGNSWSITSDMMTFRTGSKEPLFFADEESKLEILERTYGIPRQIALTIMKQFGCGSDLDFSRALEGVGNATILMDCCKVAGNNFDHAVQTARIVCARQMDIQSAYNLLASSNFVVPQ